MLARPAWSFAIAHSTNANTSLDGGQRSSECFSQQPQTCSANLVGIRNVRSQLRRQLSLRRSADSPSLGAGVAHSGSYPFLDKRTLELCHRADDLKHQSARRRREVEIVAK